MVLSMQMPMWPKQEIEALHLDAQLAIQQSQSMWRGWCML